MISLFLRNLFFTILQPGIVLGLIPYLLARDKFRDLFHHPFGMYQFAGMILFFIGVCIVLYCVYRFAVEGHGTLSPADPTKRLVVKGLYQYSRNPMYIGVVLALAGEVIFSGSNALFLYTAIISIMFNFFIILVEEPRLRKDFGEEYITYSKKVRRWM